jgi:hypothetical protein
MPLADLLFRGALGPECAVPFRLAALSPQGEMLVAEQSTHYIQFDRAELRIEAINHVLEAE